eukprot:TRINITY_DN8110_c0_g1_i2.p1 TRINITY_DN8110_c0_g1~~TRINITY_DN8110_c0_g1_i2.p1  ORF type:complete len:200 (-),score=12.39 TRINITY_DN8110_c0_g1_i2:48-647(-)
MAASRVGLSSGSCGCVVAIQGAVVTVAHVGDCRAVTCRKGEPVVINDLTVDHSPRSIAEEKRLALANVEMSTDGYFGGQLAVSRSFGDMSYETFSKCRGVICEPDIAEVPITEHLEFVLVASDGIFGSMSCTDAVLTVRRALRQGESPQSAAELLVQTALRNNSDDNLSALVVVFNKPGPLPQRLGAPRLQLTSRNAAP